LGDEGKLKGFLRFARLVVTAEGLTVPGRANLLGLGCVFLLVVGGGLLDIVQALVRVWNSQYESGLPSLLSFVWVYGVLFLACVSVLVIAEVVTRPSNE
jgi:hypothetical protein